jgi:hypothetical protein
MMQRSEYLSLRREFESEVVKLIIVAESPPKSGLYFYRTDGEPTEPLFRAMMEQIGVRREAQKPEGLRRFRECGWLLVDATYKPVNEPGDRRRRDRVIKEDYPQLVREAMRHDDVLLDVCRPQPPRSAYLIFPRRCSALERSALPGSGSMSSSLTTPSRTIK